MLITHGVGASGSVGAPGALGALEASKGRLEGGWRRCLRALGVVLSRRFNFLLGKKVNDI